MRRVVALAAEVVQVVTAPLGCAVRRRHDPVWTGREVLCRRCLLPVRR